MTSSIFLNQRIKFLIFLEPDSKSVPKRVFNSIKQYFSNPNPETYVILENDVEVEDNCSICLNPMTKDDKKLPDCPHRFHEDCIKNWIEKNNTCPNCRTKILPHIHEDSKKLFVYARKYSQASDKERDILFNLYHDVNSLLRTSYTIRDYYHKIIGCFNEMQYDKNTYTPIIPEIKKLANTMEEIKLTLKKKATLPTYVYNFNEIKDDDADIYILWINIKSEERDSRIRNYYDHHYLTKHNGNWWKIEFEEI